VDRDLTGMDPVAWLEADRAARIEEERDRAERSLPSSGYGRLAVGLGAQVERGERPVSLVTLQSGGLWEDLGDHRLHGLQATSEIQVLAGEVRLDPGAGLGALLASDFTLAGYRTLRRDVPTERRRPLDEWGWGLRAGWDYRSDRQLSQRVGLEAEGLLVLDESPDCARFTALGLGGRGQTRWGDVGVALGVGPRFTLSHRSHLFGPYANALRLEAAYAPLWQVGWGGGRWIQEVDGTASLAFVVKPPGRWAFQIGPRLRLEWSTEPHLSESSSPALSASVFVELLE
jgi:hypothetical protein